MPREATGELRRLADGFAARITIQGRDRKDFALVTCKTEPEAEARCKALAQMAARLRRAGHADDLVKVLEMAAAARAGRPWEAMVALVDHRCAGTAREKAREVPFFEDLGKSWTSGELARLYPDHVKVKATAGRDEELLRIYVYPHVQGVRVDEFSLDHAEYVMANVPACDPRRPSKPLSRGQRRHIAQTMGRLMRLAVYPCKWREASPIPPNWLPKEGAPLAKECLFPDEDALLLGGRPAEDGKEGVPVLRRLAYGFLSREGMRAEEMASLRWSDVDLRRGRVVLDENKTDDPRDWDLRPDVVEALTRWKARQPCTEPGDHVFADGGVPLNVMHLADLLRKDLRRVGVTRSQLFERKAGVRLPIRAHDLRATFVTVSLAIGRTETFISDRTGHRSHEMINAYRRKARTWNQGDLGPMHELIPELADGPVNVDAMRPIPPGLPHDSTMAANSQRAQRKPIP